MKEWSDEELDKLFQNSAEEFEPQFDPDDWKQFRHRLDDADQVIGGGWLENGRPWTIALLLLMILGGISVYYGSSKLGVKRDTKLTASDKRSPGSSAQTKEQRDAEETHKASVPYKREASETLSGNKADQGSEIDPKPVLQRKEIKELSQSLANVSGVRKQTDLRNRERGDGAILLPKDEQQAATLIKNNSGSFLTEAQKAATPGDSEAYSEKMEVEPEKAEEAVAQAGQPTGRAIEGVTLERLTNKPVVPAMIGLAYPPVTSSRSAESASVKPESPVAGVPQWAIRVGVSPDLSFVNMNLRNMARPGPAAALLVERSIAQRWVVQAGVVRSLKTYSAQAGAYEWPSNWYQRQKPVSVDGSCQVLELPLNIRYDISQARSSRWFAGAGVSSYKMQNEKYVYHYKTYDPTIRWWKWEGETGWYLFSHANASVGYERLLTKRLSIMAEPYIRIPLRGVGFGKVNLFSTGVWFSIRYAPVLKK